MSVNLHLGLSVIGIMLEKLGGGAFSTQIKEHIENIKMFAQGSNITNHAWKLDDHIDIDNATITDKGNY